MKKFTYEDMKMINRPNLGKTVPLELFRTVRLIGLNNSLPMGGKSTTSVIGRGIGQALPVKTINDVLHVFDDLKIAKPSIVSETDHKITIKMEECFCSGLPVTGEMVCDLEGSILEGALQKVLSKKVKVKETKCNVHGDDHCEYECLIID